MSNANSQSQGTSKRIVWDAGKDIPDVSGKQYVVKVTATSGATVTNGRIWFLSPKTSDKQDDEIWSMEPDGSDPQKMVELTSGYNYGAFAISPKGTDIAFVHQDATDFPLPILGFASYSLKIRKVSGGPVTKIFDQGGPYTSVGWSLDGARILLTSGQDPYVSFLIILDSGSFSVLFNKDVNISLLRAAWSSDGSQIFFTGYRVSQVGGIFVIKPDGTGLRTILGADSFGYSYDQFGSISVSPSGSQIAYSRKDKGIFVANLDGSLETLITSQKGENVQWSPDGKEMVFNEQGIRKLYRVRSDGTNLQAIEPKGTGKFAPWYPIWGKRQKVDGAGLSPVFSASTFDPPLTPKTGDGTGSLGIGNQKTKILGNVKPGQKVDIQVAFNQEITGATGFAVVLTFDPKKLSVVSSKGDGVFVNAIFPGPPQVRDSTVTYAGAFLRQTTTAKGPVAVLTFQTSNNFAGDTEVTLTTLTIRIPGSGKDFRPGASVVISSGIGGAPSPDFDGNGVVDFDDFFLFASAFGKKRSDAGFDAKFDLDGNGEVDFNDFFIFADAFGKKAQ